MREGRFPPWILQNSIYSLCSGDRSVNSIICNKIRGLKPAKGTKTGQCFRHCPQTVKKVPSSRHVRMDGTHTGKFCAESVRAALRRVRGSAQKFCPQGDTRGKEFLPRDCAQKWVPPGAWRFCDTLRAALQALPWVSAWFSEVKRPAGRTRSRRWMRRRPPGRGPAPR